MASISASADQASLQVGYGRLAALLRDVVAEESVDAVLGRLSATLRELVRCEDVVVWERLDEQMLRVVLVDGEDEEELRSLRIRLGDGLTGRAALERHPIVSNDAHRDPLAGVVPGTELTPEAVACMPLIARERLLGVLSLYRRGADRAFAADEVALLTDFAAVAALALDNARTRSELERLATTDDLTGLPNRRRFQTELEREIATANRYGSPLSLLLLDLDNFKAINDTYGHHAGDNALRRVAAAIEAQLRTPDLVARLGGDEFAVLLPQTAPADADALARRLKDTVAQALPSPQHVTISIGMSTLAGGGPSDLLEEADRFLYRAKRSHPSSASIHFQTREQTVVS
jgi:diguanylate cyclase (GGDEF)-like protein